MWLGALRASHCVWLRVSGFTLSGSGLFRFHIAWLGSRSSRLWHALALTGLRMALATMCSVVEWPGSLALWEPQVSGSLSRRKHFGTGQYMCIAIMWWHWLLDMHLRACSRQKFGTNLFVIRRVHRVGFGFLVGVECY